MNRSTMLLVDAVISLVLGLVLVAFPRPFIAWLGLPAAQTTFYASLLGAVVVGVAIALLVERRRKPHGIGGLGLGGAIAIDLCAAVVLAGWLLLGELALALQGRILLWSIVVLLLAVSGLGVLAHRKETTR